MKLSVVIIISKEQSTQPNSQLTRVSAFHSLLPKEMQPYMYILRAKTQKSY